MNDVEKCNWCGKVLKSKESIERGYGPSCYKKYLKSLKEVGLLNLVRRENDDNSNR